MKRLALLVVVGLLCLTSRGWAYDGPTLLTYDQTLGTIQVVMTTQSKIFFGGYAKFTMTARVPVAAAHVGQQILLQIRQYEPIDGDQIVGDTCTYVPTNADVGQTVIYTCDFFASPPASENTSTEAEFYPYVTVASSPPGSELLHDGQALRLTVPIIGDDTDEDNDSILTASNLNIVGGAATRLERHWLDFDYYKFTAPAGSGSAQISIRFWNQAADLDLYVYDQLGDLVNASASSLDDEEVVNIAVTPGQNYYFAIEAADPSPAFYDLFVTVAGPDIITITSGPSGNPNPVAGGGTVNLTLNAVDSLGHTLTYFWTQSCPTLPTVGTFNSRFVPNPVWTAPPNSGGQQNCLLKVEISDGHGVSTQTQFTEGVASLVHTLTITSGPGGTPNPVASQGSVAVTTTAADSFAHGLTYTWQATCVGLASNGSFTNGTTASPTWTAPANLTGTQKTCTIAVTADDGQGLTASNSYSQGVNSVPDTVTITAGPSGTPEPVTSSGNVSLSVTATDSLSHTLSYSWQASCPNLGSNGSFTNGTTATPTWTAPANLTGSQQTCTISVTANDGQSHTASGQVTATVNSVADTVTITAGPSGTPDPVASAGNISLSVTANDSLSHSLSYTWQATCSTLPSNGSFTDGTTATPTWTAPANTTGSQQTCSMLVVTSDGFGHSASNSVSLHVNSVPDTVTITAGPSSSSNPVASSGTVTLNVVASDSISHSLGYSWQATCATLGDNGTFSPSATDPSPTWTAPANLTGLQQGCTISVTADDSHSHTATGSFTQNVSSVGHTVNITSGPGGSPNPVASAGAMALSVSATDSLTHSLSYTWQAACPSLSGSGSFSPDANTQNATWTAPANTTGSQQSCTLTVTADDGQGQTSAGNFTANVAAAHALTLTQGPTGTQNPVASGAAASLSVAASDTFGHTLQYAWSASCPALGGNGSFTNGATSTPTWTAPSNLTGSPQTCTIQVVIDDGAGGLSQTGSYQHVVNSVAHSLTITSGPSGAPNPVASGGSIAATVSASDSLNHALAYSWTASCPALGGNGSFVNGTTATPTWTAPANLTGSAQNCTLQASVNDGNNNLSQTASYQQTVNPSHVLTITQQPGGNPNPVASNGAANLTVAANDSLSHALTYAWSATCPALSNGGSFSNPAAQSPSWTAPANLTGSPQTCTITLVVNDGANGLSQTASYTQTVNSPAHTLTITTGPSGTPNPLASGATANLSVTGSDSLNHTIGYSWSASCPQALGGNGSFSDSSVAAPAWTAPANPGAAEQSCTISVTLSDGQGQSVTGSYTHAVAPGQQTTTEYRYYFAEGATIGGFFETRFALLNKDASNPAEVIVEFQLKDTTTVLTHELTLPAHTRTTIDVGALGNTVPALAELKSAEFSTVVRSDRPLVADRTMTWNQSGYGSHGETAIAEPASEWYLAEGATIGDFELYYLIQNPNPESLNDEIEVTYLLPPPAAPIVRHYSMGANTRTNIAVHSEPGLENVEVSAIIRTPSNKPVIVERAMYLTAGGLFYGAGHESAGIRSPEQRWFFAEGATGAFFDMFILIGNPNATAAGITATFLFDDGTLCSMDTEVGPKSRFNIWVDMTEIPGCPRSLADAAVSTTITSDIPVVAERTMWWPGPSWAEAHNAAGATTTGIEWALADGEQGGARASDTYILIANASNYAGTARVTLYFEDGSTQQKDVPLQANSRTNVSVGAPVEFGGFGAAVTNKRFGASIESLPVSGQAGPAEIVVERAMYSNGPGAPMWAAGTDVLATKIR